MNKDILEGNWKQIRGSAKEWWGKLTDSDFDRIAGKRDQLVGACKASANAACTGDVAGRANFGFVSKYNKGATVPEGQTEFQFQDGNLNFHSSNYQWLVVSGAIAQFKGTGTINGQGSFDFIVTAVDGQVSGGGGVDKFRIKISGSGVIYDNLPAATNDEPTLGNAQPISGGSIVIHAK